VGRVVRVEDGTSQLGLVPEPEHLGDDLTGGDDHGGSIGGTQAFVRPFAA
jgi:hypothetical protein